MTELSASSFLSQPALRPSDAAPARAAGADRWLQRAAALLERPRSPRTIALLLAAWIVGVGNLATWRLLGTLAARGEMGPEPARLMAGLAVVGVGITFALLLLFAWPKVLKPAALFLLVLAGVVQHYMLAYGIVVDSSMVANALQTNTHETLDLLGWGLAGQVLLVAGPPALWLRQVRLAPVGAWGQAWRNGLVLALAVGTTAGALVGMYRELAPLVRNNMELRFMLNPFSAVSSTVSTVTKPLRQRKTQLVSITAGAALGPSYSAVATSTPKPPLFVVVVGETARADHFALNGYPRDTTPELARRGVTSFTGVRSCGTNTLASVPCMFSSLGKVGYEGRKAEHENLLDVLQAAGLAVLWVDNQNDCKGVCQRVPHALTRDTFAPAAQAAAALCRDGECLDEVMLAGLDERIAALPAERRAKGVVLVMHQLGSHGPAYYRRSSAASKRFLPECNTHALADCDRQALLNVYDNSIVETDRFLARTIDWLHGQSARHATGMLYVSDHGESLGEYGLFLHGMPYALAPDEQKHVPMVLWMDDGLARRALLSRQCVTAGRDRPLTHDNLYHTVLGTLDVQTPSYRAGLDALASCRGASATAAAGPAVPAPPTAVSARS
ncbi:phosphoethanolamine transferase [Xylophilus sp. Leaf220]|uniref:phosphoethanolamine transferase n=1 Tax=Xylophilus sp. Leaf220 TaxID=1735686 RepID=UPI000A9D85C4|nr:sulfatase-like hydrolase/transferase [Xylophilus sp. Leaf220]